jgi:hypothetical protein
MTKDSEEGIAQWVSTHRTTVGTARLVGAMMTGEAGSVDQIGMAWYGIKITSVKKVPAVMAEEQRGE